MVLRRRISSQTAQSSLRLRRELFFALCCFFVFSRCSLSAFCLGLISFGSSGNKPDVQVLDTLRLFRGRLIRHSILPRFDNGIVESSVAAVRVVALFSTVVGLHDHSVGLCGYIAGPLDLAVDCSGDMVQQSIQGNSQSSFRIDSLYMLSIALRLNFAKVCHTCSHSVRPGPRTC